MQADISFILDEVEDEVYDELWERAKVLCEVCQQFTPVDTGRLQSSWQYDVLKDTDGNYVIRLVNSQPYALYIEYYGYFMVHKAYFRVLGCTPQIRKLGTEDLYAEISTKTIERHFSENKDFYRGSSN